MKRTIILISLALLGLTGCNFHGEHVKPAPVEHEPLQAVANFSGNPLTIYEKDITGTNVSIELSQKVTGSGSITLLLQSDGAYFTATPTPSNNKLFLKVENGATSIAFSIFPIDDTFFTGERKIELSISETTGNIIRGTQFSQSITIIDDELAGKIKGYEAFSGNWHVKKELVYDPIGRIDKLIAETTRTYSYDFAGRIEKISSPHTGIRYMWTGDRIEKSETTYMGTLKSYTEYDYNGQGNVSAAQNFFRQPDGSFQMAFENRYVYHPDGNLFKSETILDNGRLISIKTYDGYIDALNPFPMVDIHPAVKTQHGLPTIHTIQENGTTLNYYLTYEFDDSDKVIKRTSESETIIYNYY